MPAEGLSVMLLTTPCESFFATVPCTRLERRRFAPQAEERKACFSFIEVYKRDRNQPAEGKPDQRGPASARSNLFKVCSLHFFRQGPDRGSSVLNHCQEKMMQP
jgi:hypothetical protein